MRQLLAINWRAANWTVVHIPWIGINELHEARVVNHVVPMAAQLHHASVSIRLLRTAHLRVSVIVGGGEWGLRQRILILLLPALHVNDTILIMIQRRHFAVDHDLHLVGLRGATATLPISGGASGTLAIGSTIKPQTANAALLGLRVKVGVVDWAQLPDYFGISPSKVALESVEQRLIQFVRIFKLVCVVNYVEDLISKLARLKAAERDEHDVHGEEDPELRFHKYPFEDTALGVNISAHQICLHVKQVMHLLYYT